MVTKNIEKKKKKNLPNSWGATTGRKMGMTAADQWSRLQYKLYRKHFEFSSLIRCVSKIIEYFKSNQPNNQSINLSMDVLTNQKAKGWAEPRAMPTSSKFIGPF
jgi:hypothetical protein